MSFNVQRSASGGISNVIRTAFGAQRTSNVTVTTTTETSATNVTCTGLRGGSLVLVFGFIHLTTGTGTTTVTTTLERGTTAGGTIIGEANAITIPTVAGSTDVYLMMTTDTTINNDQAYNITVTQAGATGDGTILQASIAVIPLATF